ncbi:endonuclease [Methylobacillus arboreus]|uniref:endonuclease/exonuclease/phosphatase family protein n=1 Tax=Methylobacillus arboreus TaxID=755170 RepID=UPI001E4BA8A3|nr:endonuclease/exonuclease/phosphatase family protein [Methylobacillus arboreus]MCB5191464.1 endonuclease [Methylobacillus arboreus]
MQRIRLLCFNIHGGRSLDGRRDLSRIHGLMQRLDIDIGVFQEMETRHSHGGLVTDVETLAGPERPYRLACPSMEEGEGWYGNLIVSRYPIIRGLLHNLETHPSLEPRHAADALIQGPLGKLRVIGTHLSLSIFERRSEARNLMRLMQAVEEEERSPILLMGDINEWQVPSSLLRYLNRQLTPLPCKPTFPSICPIFRLDRVWHDAPGIKVTAHRLPGEGIRRLSDHLPLVVELEY